jgi:endonuclease/exonuclease/phosphatase family metal-dependent hydrolase
MRLPTTTIRSRLSRLLCVGAFCLTTSRAFPSQPKTSHINRTMHLQARSGGLNTYDTSCTTRLCIATYNIWFGTTGYEEERMEAIIENLAPHTPHLIGIQEVTPHLAQLLCPKLESLNYHTILQPFGSYVCGIALKVDTIISSGFHPFGNSKMGRGIVWALAEQDGREVLFTTTHLESFLGEENNGCSEREVQLEEMVEFCNRCMRERSTLDLAVISGDLNWDDERPRSQGHNRPLMSLLDSTKWTDTYRELEPTGRGYTYDPVENPMLGGDNIRRRFDRILVQKRVGKAEVDTVEMVGTEAIPGISYMTPRTRFRKPQRRLVAPSDHFGLVAKLTF